METTMLYRVILGLYYSSGLSLSVPPSHWPRSGWQRDNLTSPGKSAQRPSRHLPTLQDCPKGPRTQIMAF